MIQGKVERPVSSVRDVVATVKAPPGKTAQITAGTVTLFDDSTPGVPVSVPLTHAAVSGFDAAAATTVQAYYTLAPSALGLSIDSTYFLVFYLTVVAGGRTSTQIVNVEVRIIADPE